MIQQHGQQARDDVHREMNTILGAFDASRRATANAATPVQAGLTVLLQTVPPVQPNPFMGTVHVNLLVQHNVQRAMDGVHHIDGRHARRVRCKPSGYIECCHACSDGFDCSVADSSSCLA